MAKGHIPRFYAEDGPTEGLVKLTQEQVRHSKALRMEDGDRLQLFDGVFEYEAQLEGVKARITSKSEPKPQIGQKITLAVAWPKGNRGDWLVEKATELGVSALIPLLTKRTIVEPGATKVARLRKVIINACEQSGRTILPSITEPMHLKDVLAKKSEFDVVIIADRSGEKLHVHGQRVLVLIGPEGGFIDEEISEAKAEGAKATNLGSTTLRTETAAISVVAALNALYAP